MKKKLLFICPYPEKVAAGQRLKFEPHFSMLKEAGYEVTMNSFMSNTLWKVASKKGHFIQKIYWTLVGLARRIMLIPKLGRYDCVYIFMNVFPFGPPILEKIYLNCSKKVIFDIEDDLLSEESGSINWLAALLKSKNKTKYLIQNSHKIIASSPDLAKKCIHVSGKNNVHFIPPTLESLRFIPRKNSNLDKKIVIGWTGTFSSRPFLDQIIPALELLSKERNFTLMVIGNFEMKNKNLDLKVVQWNADEEINQLHNFDIGLYPLPNSNWVSGKSGLKALQYMAMSIPPVCTAVGNVINFIDDDKNGILIYNQEDWLHNLRLLIDDVEKRERIGRNARIKFMQDFSQEAIFEKYLDIISE